MQYNFKTKIMKLIGKNSVSKYFSYFFLILFLFIAFHFIYEIIGFSVLYYKYKTGSNILSEYFLLGNDVGWAKNEYTNPIKDVLKFKIYYPFTEQNLLTGIYTKIFITNSLISSSFFTIFSFVCYKITEALGKDYIFNLKTINFVHIIHLLGLKIQFFVQKNVIFVLKFCANLKKLTGNLSE